MIAPRWPTRLLTRYVFDDAVKESGGYVHSMRMSRRVQFTLASVAPASMPTVTPRASVRHAPRHTHPVVFALIDSPLAQPSVLQPLPQWGSHGQVT